MTTLTPEELRALVEVLNRCPLTLAERLTIQRIVGILEQQLASAPEDGA